MEKAKVARARQGLEAYDHARRAVLELAAIVGPSEALGELLAKITRGPLSDSATAAAFARLTTPSVKAAAGVRTLRLVPVKP